MGYASTTCAPGERIRYRAHYHWLYWTTGIALCAAPLVALAAGSSSSTLGVAILLGTGLFAPFGIFILIRTLTSEIIVTSDRFVKKTGLISFNAEDISLDKVEEVNLRQDILGAIFGYGALEVHGSGQSEISVTMIQSPEGLRKAIENAGEAQ
jgi:uncharacterized membrane protein YdbT with pleckstrin-like domain